MNLQELMQNPYAWAVLSTCTIVALIFAVYTWIVGKKKKEFSCFSNTFEVVKGGKSVIPKLSLLYDGQTIDDLTITKYAIWNSGNEVLNWSDIVAVSSLQVVCNDNAKILDAQILVQSDETNIFRIVEKKDNCVKINFDYANVNDGVILQILHTGEATDFNIECKIKGGKKFRNLNHNIKKKNRNHKKNKMILAILMGIDVFLVCVMPAFMVLVEASVISQETIRKIWFLDSVIGDTFWIMLLFVLVGLMLIMYCGMLKHFFYLGIPAKLRKSIEWDDFGNRKSASHNQ